jgi:hypothetical protein
MECPLQLAGPHVVRPDIPHRRRLRLDGSKPDDDEVLEDHAGSGERHVVLRKIEKTHTLQTTEANEAFFTLDSISILAIQSGW